MYLALFGLAAGIGMPMQTSINAQLGRRAGSPFTAAMLNFFIGLGALLIITLFWEKSLAIPFSDVLAAPPWILMGGVFAVIFVTGNILLMPRLGSVQTVILPALGQIIMGTLIDTFGWFDSIQRALSIPRIIGIALVFAGVVVVISAKAGSAARISDTARSTPTGITGALPRGDSSVGSAARISDTAPKRVSHIWLWRAFGLLVGMAMASQTAVNSHLGVVVDSRLFASVINFSVGTTLLILLNLILLKNKKPWDHSGKAPLWIWSGGLFGALFVVGNIITAQTVGTGMAVVILLTGLMIGGMLVDGFGMFRSAKRPVGKFEILGVIVMVCGAVLFYMA